MTKALLISFALVASIASLAPTISACVCAEYGTPPCAAYARADAVFTGTILQVEEDKSPRDEPWPMLRIEFAIDDSFKNISGKTVQVLASTGTDCSSKYEIGERLLVYAHKDSSGKRLTIWDCDRTTSLASADEDLAYIRQAVKGLSKQTVSGALRLNGYEAMRGVPVVAELEQKRYASKTDAEGRFSIDLPSIGAVTVRATVPFSAGAMSHRAPVDEKTTEAESVFTYLVNLPKGQCDYRELEVYRVDLKATAQITGKVVDQDGKARPSIMVYLYPATPDQNFSSGGYEWKRTDAEGRYTFDGLREGRFWLGVNLGRMPEVDSPYATTFFPGVPDLSTAAVVLLEQGQQLRLSEMRIPPKLIEREVTGVLLWPDGSPVARLSPDAAATVGPVFSLYNPKDPRFSLNTRRLDGSWTSNTMPDGHFSFTGFEGYTYVLHVHAWDRNDKLMHANVKVTIMAENKPLRLVLSQPGYGEGDDIKKEIGPPQK